MSYCHDLHEAMGGSLAPLLQSSMSMTTTKAIESHESQNPFQNLQNPFPNQHQMVSQLHPLSVNGLQSSFSPASSLATMDVIKEMNNNNNPSPSNPHLFKSLLSNQVCNLKEQSTTIPKQLKTEVNFSLFQLPNANLRWLDTVHHDDPYANPLFHGMDFCGVAGFSSAAPLSITPSATTVSENYVHFNCFQ